LTSPTHLLQFNNHSVLKPVLQTEAAECGLACLAMMVNYYGHRIDINTLRQKYPISLKGTNLQNLIVTADKLQLSSRPLRLEIDELKQLKLPCIIHWNMNHFVVLKKVSHNEMIIIDPAIGEKKYKKKQLAKHFTGVVLELLPSKTFIKKNEEKQLKLSALWDRIIGLKRMLTQIFILSLLLQLFVIVSPFYMQLVVDEVLISHDLDLLSILAIGFCLMVLFNIAVSALRSIMVMLLSTQINIQISNNLFRHLIRLPLDWFEKRHIGDVISRFSSLDQVKQILTTGLIEAVIDGIMIIGTLLMMYLYSPLLAWIVIISVLAYGLFRLALYRPLRQLNEENIITNAKEDSNFIETIRAVQTVKIFNKEIQRQLLWQNLYADALNASIRLTKLNIAYTSFNGLLFGLENILVIYLAASHVIDGVMSVGMLYAFMAYKGQFTAKASALIEKMIQFKMLSLHLTRIGDIVLTETESDTSPTPISTQLASLSGSMELNNISFRYTRSEAKIINDLTIKITAGQSIAIIGPSGCGKSTLMKIMLGLLKPESGKISIDGFDIVRLGNQNYRRQIAAVMQDDQLFSGTIADNICFFDPEFSQSSIEACAKLAAIDNDIMAMPMAYNSLIGDMGNTLSGGQKQRLLLARALYKKPKILFLDEATSHLDCALENHVNETIKFLKMTRIIIAHRQETIDSADRVIKLENGKLVEQTHKQKGVDVKTT